MESKGIIYFKDGHTEDIIECQRFHSIGRKTCNYISTRSGDVYRCDEVYIYKPLQENPLGYIIRDIKYEWYKQTFNTGTESIDYILTDEIEKIEFWENDDENN